MKKASYVCFWTNFSQVLTTIYCFSSTKMISLKILMSTGWYNSRISSIVTSSLVVDPMKIWVWISSSLNWYSFTLIGTSYIFSLEYFLHWSKYYSLGNSVCSLRASISKANVGISIKAQELSGSSSFLRQAAPPPCPCDWIFLSDPSATDGSLDSEPHSSSSSVTSNGVACPGGASFI